MLARGTLKNAFFFEKFYRGHHLPHPRLSPYTPPVETPAPSAPGTTAHDRQQHRLCQNQGGQVPGQTTPRHAQTLYTLHRSALDTRQAVPGADRDGGGGWRVCSVSETEQIRTIERCAKTGPKIITILCMFVACATLQIHEKVLL